MAHPPTRRDLYEMVWKEPVEDVAKRYGLSGRGLAKLCERHGVPVPPRGYWQKHAAGQKQKRPPLIETPDTAQSTVGLMLTNATRSEAIKRGNERRSSYATLFEERTEAVGFIAVPQAPRNWHPIVVQERLRERQHPIAYRRLGYGALEELPESSTDAMRRLWPILNALIKHLEQIGFKVGSSGWGRFDAFHAGFKFEWSIGERIRQYRRLMSDSERAKNYDPNQRFRQIKELTGELQLGIKAFYYPPIPAKWTEEDGIPLEQKLSQFVAGLLLAIQYEAARRDEIRREELLRLEREAERERARLEKEREQARRKKLVTDSQSWRDAEAVRTYISAVRMRAATGQALKLHLPLEQWLEWAKSVAQELDPLPPLKDGSSENS